MAAPSHRELKVSGRFGNWIRNDIQYCSFQVYQRLNRIYIESNIRLSGLWSYIRSLLKNTILREGCHQILLIGDNYVFIYLIRFLYEKNIHFSWEELTFIAKYKRKINYSFKYFSKVRITGVLCLITFLIILKSLINPSVQ